MCEQFVVQDLNLFNLKKLSKKIKRMRGIEKVGPVSVHRKAAEIKARLTELRHSSHQTPFIAKNVFFSLYLQSNLF